MSRSLMGDIFGAKPCGNEDMCAPTLYMMERPRGERQTGGRERQVSEGCGQQSSICQLAAHS